METVPLKFHPNQKQIPSLVLATPSIESTIDDNLDFPKNNSAERKRLVFVAKHFAAMTHNQKISNLAAKS